MAEMQKPPLIEKNFRVHRIHEDDEHESPKDFRNYMEVDDDDDEEPKPSPMAAFSPMPFQLDAEQNTTQALPQIQAIAHTLVETITVIEDKGIQTTIVDIGKGQFKGSSITITLYDTHPTSYNIELVSAPDAMLIFHQNLPTLQSLLEKALPEHIFRVQAALSSDDTFRFKKRDKNRTQKPKPSR